MLNHLPHDAQTPAWQQMFQWIVNPFALMESSAQRYGDLFTLPIGDKLAPVVLLHSPQLLQEVLADSKDYEAPGDRNGLFEPILGQQSVLSLSGAAHRRQRQLLLPPFHGERMRMYGQMIWDITGQVIERLPVGQPFSVRSFMQSIAMQVILQTVFGLEQGERVQRLERLVAAMLDSISSPLGVAMLYIPSFRWDLGRFSPWGRFLHQRQQIDQLIYREIHDRRQAPNPDRTDILSLLMSACDEVGQPLTDVELRDELMTLLVAGHETTATALTWALYWLHALPEVKAKALRELDSLGDQITPATVARLPYLAAISAETLRIYPVGMLAFPRVPKTAQRLMGYEIEAGTVLLGCIYLLHQREDLYPEPKRFKPERFLLRQFSPYEYMPFGVGARRCIGMAFAQYEMQIVLARMLSEVELKLINDRPMKPVRRGLTSGAGDVRLTVVGRRSLPARTLEPLT
ncbi:cytochrome P450 [Pantanalinema sp. GBBB05]|uniref:cytochrome P450 n=1 Tax=Pantanalinema sp. GBBB05 TaxID=2604139 RepID=UPI001D84ABB1|nr:cytochrome P450 [Pantanalinema sp. GBBB05]